MTAHRNHRDACAVEDGESRLDRALAALVPGLGLRGRRRLVSTGRVLLNGQPCHAPGRKLRPGDRLTLTETPDTAIPDGPHRDAGAGMAAGARLLARAGDYCFFFKPAGLHTVALAGSNAPSLERLLPALMAAGPSAPPSASEGAAAPPALLQRLDRETSGLVCAASGAAAAERFRAAEAAGHCEKRYLALLAGALHEPRTVRNALDTRHRRICRVLAADAAPARWTELVPLHVLTNEDRSRVARLLWPGDDPGAATLAGCVIRRGQRHQIRAHAASVGHPLLGDALYGPESAAACPGRPALASGLPAFFLHHGSLRLPHTAVSVPPPWPWLALLPGSALRAIAHWFGTDRAGR